MSDVTDNEKLLRALKQHQPAKVRVLLGDDDDKGRDVAVSKGRKRWGAVIAAVTGRAWTRVEMLNGKGEILGYCENTNAAEDVEELTGRKASVRSEAEWATTLAVRTAERMLAFRAEEHRELLKAQSDVMRELTGAVKGLSSIYREQAEAAADVAAMRAEADNGGNLKQLMEAAPAILQALPVLQGMLNGKGSKS
jgi:hypothetical protein